MAIIELKREYADAKGGKLTIFQFSTNEGEQKLIVGFQDVATRLIVVPEAAGFKAYDTLPQAEGEKEVVNQVVMDGGAATVQCGGNAYTLPLGWKRNRVAATANVAEEVTRERILAFAAEHPELANELKQIKVRLTVLNGQPATLSELEAAPPSRFKACPADKRDLIVERK